MNTLISASLLASNFCELSNEIEKVEQAGVDWLHFDVMDGIFVNNISFGEPVLGCVAKKATVPIDVHLMITDPKRYVENYARLGASIITVHYEACDSVGEVLEKIKSLGCKVGLSVKPATPVKVIEPFISMLDMILIMTVEPGFGGQVFLEETLDKITQARKLAENFGRNIHVQVDGGINDKTATLVRSRGADVLVSGSYLFKAENPYDAVKLLRGSL